MNDRNDDQTTLGESPNPGSALPARRARNPAKATVVPAAVVERTAPIASGGADRRPGESADAEKGVRKDKREKVVRDSFSLPANEHKQIKAMREALGKAGRLASKSEVLRMALSLLSARSTSEMVALLDALPLVRKGKRDKKG